MRLLRATPSNERLSVNSLRPVNRRRAGGQTKQNTLRTSTLMLRHCTRSGCRCAGSILIQGQQRWRNCWRLRVMPACRAMKSHGLFQSLPATSTVFTGIVRGLLVAWIRGHLLAYVALTGGTKTCPCTNTQARGDGSRWYGCNCYGVIHTAAATQRLPACGCCWSNSAAARCTCCSAPACPPVALFASRFWKGLPLPRSAALSCRTEVLEGFSSALLWRAWQSGVLRCRRASAAGSSAVDMPTAGVMFCQWKHMLTYHCPQTNLS